LCLRKQLKSNPYPFSIKRYPFKSNVIQRRSYSHLAKDVPKESDSIDRSNSSSVIPIVVYPDAFLNKSIILKDNKNKVGIYR
jgi:hypothetical protein